ncbi:MAG: hypothetical protein ACYCSG_05285 [Thermoplasmataceae archaeon]
MMITAMMAIPIIQHFNNDYATVPVESYSYGNEMIKFVGSNAFIGFQGNLFPVSWNVFELNPNFSPGSQITPFTTNNTNTSAPLIEENFSHYSTKRIQSLWQDSAIIVKWNHYVRIAEIFSFTTKGIDASIVIKNLNATGNYISAFSLNTGINNTISVNGFNPSCQNISSGMGIIPSGDWNVTVGSLSMNWQSEDSIFHSGIVSQGTSSDSIILPFDAGTLYHNESYTIDPMIYYQPFMIIRGPIGGPTPPPPPPPSSPTYYDITFTATGLPSGTSWYATLNGQTQSTSSSSITFRETAGTYSYSIGSVSGYTVSPSSGSVSVGGSQSVSVTYAAQPTNCPLTGFIGAEYCMQGESTSYNLTSAISHCYNISHTYNNALLPGEITSINLSISYQNADKGNGQVTSYASTSNPSVSPDSISGPPPGGCPFRGILVYTLNSKGHRDYPIYCNQDISGNGVVTVRWLTQPGAYGGFLVELANNYGVKYSSYNHSFDVYSRLVNAQGSNPYNNDSTAVNTVYTSGGVFIGYLGIAADGGATKGLPRGGTCASNTIINLGLSTVFLSPKNNASAGTYKYGIFDYKQYLNYTGSQYGSNNGDPQYTPICALNQAPSSQNGNSNLYTTYAEESIYGMVSTGLLMSDDPLVISVGFAMVGLGPFIFQGNVPSSTPTYWNHHFTQNSISYGYSAQYVSDAGNETVVTRTGAGQVPVPAYRVANDGNGNPSFMQYWYLTLLEPMINNINDPNQYALNLFTYTTSATIVPIAHGFCGTNGMTKVYYSLKNNDYVDVGGSNEPSYTVATSMQIYMPMQG